MKLESLYQDTILKLKNNQRPLIVLTPEILEELKLKWQEALSSTNVDESTITKILCILDNSQTITSDFNELFLTTLDRVKNQEIIIYLLGASQKHIVAHALKTGTMIPIEYFEKLKNLLKNEHPEVIEWTLRTIESMGPLSMRLKQEVLASRPHFLKLFNQHQKASRQIIDLLEVQWEKMLK
jgi:hypothetical protein